MDSETTLNATTRTSSTAGAATTTTSAPAPVQIGQIRRLGEHDTSSNGNQMITGGPSVVPRIQEDDVICLVNLIASHAGASRIQNVSSLPSNVSTSTPVWTNNSQAVAFGIDQRAHANANNSTTVGSVVLPPLQNHPNPQDFATQLQQQALNMAGGWSSAARDAQRQQTPYTAPYASFSIAQQKQPISSGQENTTTTKSDDGVAASANESSCLRTAPCAARGIKSADHNSKTAYFKIPRDIRHGAKLICSHTGCRSKGVKFLYCEVCGVPVSRRFFRIRHDHGRTTNTEERKQAQKKPPPPAQVPLKVPPLPPRPKPHPPHRIENVAGPQAPAMVRSNRTQQGAKTKESGASANYHQQMTDARGSAPTILTGVSTVDTESNAAIAAAVAPKHNRKKRKADPKKQKHQHKKTINNTGGNIKKRRTTGKNGEQSQQLKDLSGTNFAYPEFIRFHRKQPGDNEAKDTSKNISRDVPAKQPKRKRAARQHANVDNRKDDPSGDSHNRQQEFDTEDRKRLRLEWAYLLDERPPSDVDDDGITMWLQQVMAVSSRWNSKRKARPVRKLPESSKGDRVTTRGFATHKTAKHRKVDSGSSESGDASFLSSSIQSVESSETSQSTDSSSSQYEDDHPGDNSSHSTRNLHQMYGKLKKSRREGDTRGGKDSMVMTSGYGIYKGVLAPTKKSKTPHDDSNATSDSSSSVQSSDSTDFSENSVPSTTGVSM